MFDESGLSDSDLPPELAALEGRLASLQPSALQLDRDRLMFAAGQAAAEAKYNLVTPHVGGANRWLWPSATALMTAASVMLAAMLVWKEDATSIAGPSATPAAVEEKLVEQPTRADFQSVDRLTSGFAVTNAYQRPKGSYLEVRHVALTEGIGAVPFNGHSADDRHASPIDERQTQPATPRGLLEELLPEGGSAVRIRS
jgi:hypothetical protein